MGSGVVSCSRRLRPDPESIMTGRRSSPSPSISYLTSPPDQITSSCGRSRRKCQPLSGPHRRDQRPALISTHGAAEARLHCGVSLRLRSGLGHERLSGPLKASSALPFRADLDGASAIGRLVPAADLSKISMTVYRSPHRPSRPKPASAHEPSTLLL